MACSSKTYENASVFWKTVLWNVISIGQTQGFKKSMFGASLAKSLLGATGGSIAPSGKGAKRAPNILCES